MYKNEDVYNHAKHAAELIVGEEMDPKLRKKYQIKVMASSIKEFSE